MVALFGWRELNILDWINMFDFTFFWVYGRKKHDKYCVYHNAWKEWFVKQKHNLCIYDAVCKNIKAFGTMHENCHRRLTWVKQRKLKVSNIFTCRFIFFFVFFFQTKSINQHQNCMVRNAWIKNDLELIVFHGVVQNFFLSSM